MLKYPACVLLTICRLTTWRHLTSSLLQPHPRNSIATIEFTSPCNQTSFSPISTIEFTSIMVTNKGNRNKVTTVPAVGGHLSAGVAAATTACTTSPTAGADEPAAAAAPAVAAAPAAAVAPAAAAAKKEQANILFRDAVRMVRQSPALARRLCADIGRGGDTVGGLIPLTAGRPPRDSGAAPADHGPLPASCPPPGCGCTPR